MPEGLAAAALAYGIRLSEAQLAHVGRYIELLQQWSQRVNLVGDAATAVIERRHVLESLAFGAALREREILRADSSALDVGAGAGFPGVPMKIAWPGIRLTLLEATAKKTAFLVALVSDLQLDDARVVTGRAEDAAHDAGLREQFDLVVARAVAPLPTLLELTLPFARTGGHVATPKGSRAADELAASAHALATLGAGRTGLLPLRVEGPPQSVVVVAKSGATPVGYPRRAGVPKKQPL